MRDPDNIGRLQARRLAVRADSRRTLNAAKFHRPDPDYLRGLINSTGLPRARIAQRLGISDSALKRYTVPSGSPSHLPAPYLVQYALETLALSDHAWRVRR